MHKTLLFTIALFAFLSVNAQDEETAIRATLQNYLDGSSYSNLEQITSAFYPEADLFLSKKDQELWVLSPQEYADLFKNREHGKFNGRVGKILSIDQSHNIALAKASIEIPSRKMTFIDIFLLKKLQGEWKIISKAATLLPE
ncbi:nuclear transport factor 2 family protein [Flagellimonas algicola]|uniref:Nuclear transport factor 2 family protein n=1 Tax=Flagellimonas algicola TaxID=2583815 RepID=A0ABY2WJB4_9FLAO|nr:nuclear transport factor 2 family protein [Allomuricauda algicola]TMU54929.1 nuclear transport factor 2 family protein [Allomuricauda algicola]